MPVRRDISYFSIHEHSSASYYIKGKHAGYIVIDIKAVFSERYPADELLENKVKEKVVDEKEQTSS